MENKKLYGLLCCLQRTLSRKNNVNFASLGVSPVQLQAMMFVHCATKRNKTVCQRDIEKEINLRASSVSTMLVNLEKNGYITRNFSVGDARSKNITLTEKGIAVCKQNKLLFEKCDADLQNALTEEEQAQLKQLILKVFDGLKNDCENKN